MTSNEDNITEAWGDIKRVQEELSYLYMEGWAQG